METKIFDVSKLNEKLLEEGYVYGDQKAQQEIEKAQEHIQTASDFIKEGGLVAFPTETVYGLGADALNETAVKKVYKAKGRPSDNPMIVHIARASDIGQLTPKLSTDIIKLADNFWPGPLTLVLPKKDNIPNTTTGGLDTVAIRIPDNPVAIELIRLSDTPIAAPSANISGKPSPTKAEHVVEDLNGIVDCILAGEDSRVGIESTVLDLTADEPTILRPGIITEEQIEAAIGKKVKTINHLNAQDGEGPKSPGMKYKHYSPEAEMLIVEGNRFNVEKEIKRLKGLNEQMGRKVGVMLFEEKAFIEAAHDFFARLRDLDNDGVDLILAGALSDKDGVGFAVMNRMMKSAGYNIVKV